MVRHSHQDALDEPTFRALVEAAHEMRPPRDAETLLILYAGGRLGMRAGEISHMTADWVDFRRSVIDVPRHEPCDCGYCRKQAKQAADHDDDLDVEADLTTRWKPKTDASVRSIPFDFDEDVAAVVRAFFERFDAYPHSRLSVNRRVNRVAEIAGEDVDSIYPHCLRATAASYHAYRGLPAAALQSLFGWTDLDTAQKYVRLSGGQTQQALNDVHSE